MIRKRYLVPAVLLLGVGFAYASNSPDINGDGEVNSADLAQLLAAWGPNQEPQIKVELVRPTTGVVPLIENPALLGGTGPYADEAERVTYVDINAIVGISRDNDVASRAYVYLNPALSVNLNTQQRLSVEEPFDVVWQRIAPLKGWPMTPPPAIPNTL